MNKIPLGLLILVATLPGCASLTKSLPMATFRKPDTERVLSMARLMERHGKVGESASLYEGILKTDPGNPVAHHRLGILAARRGEHDVALDHFQQAARKGEPSAELLNDIGYTHYLKNDLDLAEGNLREAIRLDPQFKAARTNLGLVLAEQERFDEAIAEFRKAVSEASAVANVAYIQTKLGLLAEAEKNYHKVLDLDPTHRPAAEALVQFQSIRNKADALVARMEREGKIPAERPESAQDDMIAAIDDARLPARNPETQEPGAAERNPHPLAAHGVVQVSNVEEPTEADEEPLEEKDAFFQPPIKLRRRDR